MAVFHQNICKFNACNQKFPSLPDLIRHIEENHIESEPKFENKTLSCLPASCVLRIYSSDSSTPSSNASSPLGLDSALSTSPLSDVGGHHPLHRPNHNHHHNHHHHPQHRKSINSPAVSLSTTPTDGSELEEDLDDSDQSSIDSWATPATDRNSNPLAKYHNIMNSGSSSLDENNNANGIAAGGGSKGLSPTTSTSSSAEGNKAYVCGFDGCAKVYRSINSLNHHRRAAHKVGHNGQPIKPSPVIEDAKPRKEYRCICNKVYKTSHGLKNHCKNNHPSHKDGIGGMNTAQTTTTTTASSASPMGVDCPVVIKAEMPLNSIVKIEQPNNGSYNINLPKNENISTSANTTTTNVTLPTVKESLNTIIRLKNSQQQQQQQLSATAATSNVQQIAKGKVVATISCGQVKQLKSMAMTTTAKNIPNEPKAAVSTSTTPLPMLSAPTLQQHLLSPIVPKVATN